MVQNKSCLLAVTVIFTSLTAFNAGAQSWKKEEKINVLFGLSQPLLASGFNIEGNYIYHRLIADYSHGVSLDFKDNKVTNDLRRQGVAVHMPFTTGFGIGYRLTEWINIRIEPKWHRFEFYYENEQQVKSNQIISYNTFSLGLGLYGAYQPFKKRNNFLNGVMISPSIRYWPTAHSTLKDNTYTYFNKHTSATEEIKTLDPGFGFTPLIINISIGYSFILNKHK